MTAQGLSAIAGVLLSLAFSYIPGLSDWYGAKTSQVKSLVMLGLLLLAAAGTLAYQCRGDGACYSTGLEPAIMAFVAAAVANQTTFLLSPRA
jgi:hypothetical protein